MYLPNKQQSQGLGPGTCVLNHSTVLMSDHIVFHLSDLGLLYIAYRVKQKTLQHSTQGRSNYLHLLPSPTLFPTRPLLGSGLGEIPTLPPYQVLFWFHNFAVGAVSCLSDSSSPPPTADHAMLSHPFKNTLIVNSIKTLQVLSTNSCLFIL